MVETPIPDQPRSIVFKCNRQTNIKPTAFTQVNSRGQHFIAEARELIPLGGKRETISSSFIFLEERKTALLPLSITNYNKYFILHVAAWIYVEQGCQFCTTEGGQRLHCSHLWNNNRTKVVDYLALNEQEELHSFNTASTTETNIPSDPNMRRLILLLDHNGNYPIT